MPISSTGVHFPQATFMVFSELSNPTFALKPIMVNQQPWIPVFLCKSQELPLSVRGAWGRRKSLPYPQLLDKPARAMWQHTDDQCWQFHSSAACEETQVLLVQHSSSQVKDSIRNSHFSSFIQQEPACCRLAAKLTAQGWKRVPSQLLSFIPFLLPSFSSGQKLSEDFRAVVSEEISVMVNMKLYEWENPACLSIHSGKASEEGHLLLLAPSHLTDFAVRRKGVCHAGQTLPALAHLGQCCEPRVFTAVAENAASCPLGQWAPERGAQVPAGVNWAWGSEGRTEGGNNNSLWLSSAQNIMPNLTESCRARATQSQCKCWLVLKGESCSWPHLAMHCHLLPDTSCSVNVAGQGLGSENREGQYFCHCVFQLGQLPEQASCGPAHKTKATCTEPWERNTQRSFFFSCIYSTVMCAKYLWPHKFG